jgi:hypothetical protein
MQDQPDGSSKTDEPMKRTHPRARRIIAQVIKPVATNHQRDNNGEHENTAAAIL